MIEEAYVSWITSTHLLLECRPPRTSSCALKSATPWSEVKESLFCICRGPEARYRHLNSGRIRRAPRDAFHSEFRL